MESAIFVLIFGVIAFAYVLSPVVAPQRAKRRSRSPVAGQDEFGAILSEEAHLEIAAGKLDESELKYLQSVDGTPLEPVSEDEIEQEIRARREKLRTRGKE